MKNISKNQTEKMTHEITYSTCKRKTKMMKKKTLKNQTEKKTMSTKNNDKKKTM